jgi:hypothetical protein
MKMDFEQKERIGALRDFLKVHPGAQEYSIMVDRYPNPNGKFRLLRGKDLVFGSDETKALRNYIFEMFNLLGCSWRDRGGVD